MTNRPRYSSVAMAAAAVYSAAAVAADRRHLTMCSAAAAALAIVRRDCTNRNLYAPLPFAGASSSHCS